MGRLIKNQKLKIKVQNDNSKFKSLKFSIVVLNFALLVLSLILPNKTLAAKPTAPYFQLRVLPSTGADDTGDGRTGNPADYNHYFVGQTFNA